MENFTKLIELTNQLIEQYEKYQAKPTKAESARMRKTINEMKKLATPAKQDLVKADKGA